MNDGDLRVPDAGEVLRAVLPFAAFVALAFLLDRLRGEDTARGPGDAIRSEVARVGEKLQELAWTVGRDAKEEARKQRAWSIVQAGTGAAFTLLARRAAAGLHEAVTGRS